jgi:hypothetical protein
VDPIVKIIFNGFISVAFLTLVAMGVVILRRTRRGEKTVTDDDWRVLFGKPKAEVFTAHYSLRLGLAFVSCLLVGLSRKPAALSRFFLLVDCVVQHRERVAAHGRAMKNSSLLTLCSLLLFACAGGAKTFHRGGGTGSTVPDFAHVQLWNPPDSGVTCVIRRIQVSSDLSHPVVIGIAREPLPTPMHRKPQWIDTQSTFGQRPTIQGACMILTEGRPTPQNLGQLDSFFYSINADPYVWTGAMSINSGTGITIRSEQPGAFLRVGFSGDELRWSEETTNGPATVRGRLRRLKD